MAKAKKKAGRPKIKDKDKKKHYPVSLTETENKAIIKQHGSRTKAILKTIDNKKK